mmetsp:Transcript_3352/g.10617  ORF Transcript_3352/g.10617 Transcript_3352/m.10617 type:complete len:223 (-) Transcript_3352:44-712(-)
METSAMLRNDAILLLAARSGDTLSMRSALAAGADPNRREPPRYEGADQYAPLQLAAFFKRVEAVKLLLSAGAHVNARTPVDNMTPLLLATTGYSPDGRLCKRAHRALILALIEAGADVDAGTGRGIMTVTPFGRALHDGHRFILLDLLRAGAAVSSIAPPARDFRSASAWALVDAVKKAGGFDEYAARQLDVHVSILTKCFGDRPRDVMSAVAEFYALRGGY